MKLCPIWIGLAALCLLGIEFEVLILEALDAVNRLAAFAGGGAITHLAIVKQPAPVPTRTGRACDGTMKPPKTIGLLD
jgi:hypothetical protein